MSTVLFTCHLYKKKHSSLAGFFLAISLVCLCVVIVNLCIGERELPPPIRGTNPYFLAGMLLLLAPAIYIWVAKRLHLDIYRSGNTVHLEISGDDQPLQLQFPLKVYAHWFKVPAPKGPDQKELYVTFCDRQDNKLFSLKHTKGFIHSVSPDFSYIDPLSGQKAMVAPRQFTCRHAEEVMAVLKRYKAV
jgi:hypothetical protein